MLDLDRRILEQVDSTLWGEALSSPLGSGEEPGTKEFFDLY